MTVPARATILAWALLLACAAATPMHAQQPGALVDSLLDSGRLQEAAWAARASGDTTRAEEILARLDAILRSGPDRARPLGVTDQGTSYTWRLVHGERVESIFKVDGSDIFCPRCGTDREVAAYRVDRLLGFDLTPMTVETRIVTDGDTLHGSAMYFVNGAVTPAEAGATKPDALRLFDAVVGNSDRHGTNWLVLPGGRVVAIDHNRAFQHQPDGPSRTCWEAEIDSIARPAELGAPYRQYRTMPPDSLAAALDGLDPALAEAFVAMRERVVERVERRAANPRTPLPRRDCVFH